MGVFVRPSPFPGFELNAENALFVSGAGTLAFAIRSGVNLILPMARIQRARNVSRFVPTRTGRPVLERHTRFELIAFRAGGRVFRSCCMRSLAKILSVSVLCSVRHRSKLIIVGGLLTTYV